MRAGQTPHRSPFIGPLPPFVAQLPCADATRPMLDCMHTFYRALLAFHVVASTVGLAAMALPLLAKKGARLHRVSGWLFTAGMAISAITGILLAVAWMLFPVIFKPQSTPLQARLDDSFLALIGLLTGNALIQAIVAVRRKGSHALPGLLPRLSLYGLLAGSLGSVLLGVWFQVTLPLLFGLGSFALATRDLVFTLRPLPSPMAWWYQHMNAMGTACISAVTAFLVLGARRWVGSDVLGPNVWILWVAPSAILVPLFHGWIFWYRRKFEAKTLRTRRMHELPT